MGHDKGLEMSCNMNDMIREWKRGEKLDGIPIDGGAKIDYTWCLFAKFSPLYLHKVPICQVFTFGRNISLDSNFCAKMPVC